MKRMTRDEAAAMVSRELWGGRCVDGSHEFLSRKLTCLPDGSYWLDSVLAAIDGAKRSREADRKYLSATLDK